jgi:hypothetical protein
MAKHPGSYTVKVVKPIGYKRSTSFSLQARGRAGPAGGVGGLPAGRGWKKRSRAAPCVTRFCPLPPNHPPPRRSSPPWRPRAWLTRRWPSWRISRTSAAPRTAPATAPRSGLTTSAQRWGGGGEPASGSWAPRRSPAAAPPHPGCPSRLGARFGPRAGGPSKPGLPPPLKPPRPPHPKTPRAAPAPKAPSAPYVDVPAPPSVREPLWCERAAGGRPVELRRRIFCNRSLNMRHVRAIGFDMDYTVSHPTYTAVSRIRDVSPGGWLTGWVRLEGAGRVCERQLGPAPRAAGRAGSHPPSPPPPPAAAPSLLPPPCPADRPVQAKGL